MPYNAKLIAPQPVGRPVPLNSRVYENSKDYKPLHFAPLPRLPPPQPPSLLSMMKLETITTDEESILGTESDISFDETITNKEEYGKKGEELRKKAAVDRQEVKLI